MTAEQRESRSFASLEDDKTLSSSRERAQPRPKDLLLLLLRTSERQKNRFLDSARNDKWASLEDDSGRADSSTKFTLSERSESNGLGMTRKTHARHFRRRDQRNAVRSSLKRGSAAQGSVLRNDRTGWARC